MKFAVGMLSALALATPALTQEEVPAPSPVEVDCDATVAAYEDPIDTMTTTCEIVDGTLPGNWAACDNACATSLQSVYNDLGCCFVEYLEQLGGVDNIMYAQMAYTSVVALCEIDTSSVGNETCVDPTCDETVAEFEDPIDRNTTTCQSADGILPGNWDTCDTECAASIQTVVESLGCCTIEYLEDLGGVDNTMYATMAFPSVLELCGTDVSEIDLSECIVPTCDDVIAAYEDPIDTMTTTCEIINGTLPGNWAACDDACATSLQTVYDDVGCCFVEYLEQLGGVDNIMYAQMAYPSVVELCEIDTSSVGDEVCVEPTCDEIVAAFEDPIDSETTTCQSNNNTLPGNWDVCDTECAASIQTVVDALGCCTIEYLETLGGVENIEYATMAFPLVLDLCGTNVSNVDLTECIAEDECDTMLADYVDPIDEANTTCQLPELPGLWTECDADCAASLQQVIDDLDCCTVDYLELFAGGNEPAYAAMAFDHVVGLCNLDVSSVEGDCGDDDATPAVDSASALSTVVPLVVAAAASAYSLRQQ